MKQEKESFLKSSSNDMKAIYDKYMLCMISISDEKDFIIVTYAESLINMKNKSICSFHKSIESSLTSFASLLEIKTRTQFIKKRNK